MIAKHSHILTGTGMLCWVVAAAGVFGLARPASAEELKIGREFNERGNLTIADQFNNRVIEIDPAGNIVWSFGRGPNDFTDRSIIGCNDAQRVGPYTLMAGTGKRPLDYRLAIPMKGTMRQVNTNIYDVVLFTHFDLEAVLSFEKD